MQRFILSAMAAFGVVAAASPALAQTGPPQRHLVYDFTVGVSNDSHDAESATRLSGGGANLNGTGDAQYDATASDKGEIAVDVFGVEPDGGLVVKVSESARANRSAAPVTCVVYPTTNVPCAQGQVSPEELAVLRTLSPKFFDAGALDAKGHWHEGSDAAGISIDYAMLANANGVVTIEGQTKQTLPQDGSLVGAEKYTYDVAKTVPTQLTDYQTVRQRSGPGQYSNTIFDITATLASDSGAGKS
jgi:hypothetical protein